MKKMFKRLFLVSCFALVAASLVGCGSENKKEDSKNDTKSEEKSMVVGVTSFADTLEPTEQYFSWVVSRYGVGENLVRFNENGELEACLAEEWSVSEDHLTWDFKIREGVQFSNGTELTPESVKDSLERTFELSPRGETFFKPAAIEVEGQSVLIKTEEPVAIVPGSLADPLFLIVDTTADTEKFAQDGPICTGPYIVESFSPTDTCELVKNENYWDGEVPLDRVTMKCIDDQATRSMALQNNEIQIAYNLKTENIAEFEGNDEIVIDKLDSLRSTYAFMNQNGPLKDKKLRQALLQGIDRETYVKNLLQGGATAGKAPIPPTLDYGFDELVNENTFDPEAAKKILVEAGYQDKDGDGFVETPSGDPLDLEFVIYTSREELNVYAQAMQANMKDIGVKVTLNTVSYETLLDMRDASSFDLLIWNVLVANTGDPENYLKENWYSSSPSNQAGYRNEKVDAALDKMAVTFEEEERKKLAMEIQQNIMDDAATMFFGYETTYLFSNATVEGVKMFPMDYYWLTKDIKYAD
ncbi:peptide/nickel transport system substrate-binding protein [Enterococcus sp. PF1-24]|uniref:ABC transporter substrate-binding protein n=1 Tax=unclassified Enterococcus TaxID=2608891 RepID=UPI002473E08B|nr:MULTISPECIES: ABC transporter substrate-binding protein [unclassified Enterococcus]MDH6363248.1 peptide/nickel transport system substrate-binding protein [Enterococcus sp. PFB1-1]MDH6400451.1 peptide/nickel transport system substrate-binding protein [Enterococcus sp. PF1-24]